jgi:arylsulfate sulfotransferase
LATRHKSHSGSILTLAVFDNGNGRISGNPEASCGKASYPNCYSRAAIFPIDLRSMSAEVLWQDLPGFFSYWGGAITGFSNGNVEFDRSEPFPVPTPGARIQEVTGTNPPATIWQMDLPDGFSYRTYRIPSLYPGVVWPN